MLLSLLPCILRAVGSLQISNNHRCVDPVDQQPLSSGAVNVQRIMKNDDNVVVKLSRLQVSQSSKCDAPTEEKIALAEPLALLQFESENDTTEATLRIKRMRVRKARRKKQPKSIAINSTLPHNESTAAAGTFPRTDHATVNGGVTVLDHKKKN